ncbi:response regulator transcription factor [Nitrincola tapanii]|jgi:two-component system, NarL family, invasion response regulator UvrY|uniref:Response regulator transcription factor n=1 Tax=Nitrincola tapanii TaxID=1708751 RepID=A0A5A9W3N6_9GAMM|nr:response regulator transcription factor [Nitrincola tapanii]KAA0875366.1 response regulator transcription factor [Nitrincola tapanii]
MKILLTDDHAVVRQGYASLLSAMLEPCQIFEAGDAQMCFALWSRERPDLIVLDINLPDISGIEAARRILERDAQARILFFSMYDELPMVQQALDVGALGYITKASSPEILLEAVRRVLAGKPYVEHDLATGLVLQRNMPAGLSEMTAREFEIFVMLARGMSTKTIAEHLCVSMKTVSNHTTILKSKLQIHTSAQLVHLAIRFGVLKISEL